MGCKNVWTVTYRLTANNFSANSNISYQMLIVMITVIHSCRCNMTMFMERVIVETSSLMKTFSEVNVENS